MNWHDDNETVNLRSVVETLCYMVDDTYRDSEVYFRSYEDCLDAIRYEVSEDEYGAIRHFDMTKKQVYGDLRYNRCISIEVDRDLNVRRVALKELNLLTKSGWYQNGDQQHRQTNN